MSDYAGQITQGFGMLAAEKDKSRQVHPAIEQMIRALGPKRAAIALRLQGGEAGGMTMPGGSSAPIGDTKSLGDYAPGQVPQQGLGSVQAVETQVPDQELGGPMTTRDLEDYQKAAPFINAARERQYRDYESPEERAAREERNIKLKGTETRSTEEVKSTAKGGLQDKDLEEKRAARGQKHGEFMYKMKQDWDSLKMKLAEAKDRLRIDHGDEIAKELLKQAGANLRSAETNVKGYRTSLPELASDPGMDEEADRVEQGLPALRKEFEDTVDMLKGRKSQQGSVTKTSGGASISGPQGSPTIQDAEAKRARAKQLIFGQ